MLNHGDEVTEEEELNRTDECWLSCGGGLSRRYWMVGIYEGDGLLGDDFEFPSGRRITFNRLRQKQFRYFFCFAPAVGGWWLRVQFVRSGSQSVSS